jgi:hypothetical protein
MNSQHTDRSFCVVIHPTLSDFFIVSSDTLPDDSMVIEYKKYSFAQKNCSIRTIKVPIDGFNVLAAVCEETSKNINTDETLLCVYLSTDVFNKLGLKDFINKII